MIGSRKMDMEKFKEIQLKNLLKLKDDLAKTREKHKNVFYFDNDGKLQTVDRSKR